MATRHDFSAGGIMTTAAGDLVVIVARNLKGDQVYALPKGHPEPDESAAEAALREVREETGFEPRLVDPPADTTVEYWFRDRRGDLIHKQVQFFRMEAIAGDAGDHDAEVDAVLELDVDTALAQLTYETERDAVSRLLCV